MNQINFKDMEAKHTFQMEAKHTFQIESTVIDATISEVEKVVPIWAKNKGKSLTVLIYMGNKWQLYKVFTA